MDDQILPQLKQVSGVGEVQVIGGEKRAFRVNVDKDKLKRYGLTMTNINKRLLPQTWSFQRGKLKASKSK